MYVMEYLLYHLRPYGVDSAIRFSHKEEAERIQINYEAIRTNTPPKPDQEKKTKVKLEQDVQQLRGQENLSVGQNVKLAMKEAELKGENE